LSYKGEVYKIMMNQFHTKEYALMMYDVSRVPDGTDVLKFFKDLGKIRVFREDPGPAIDNNKVMQYILLMYDINSPYRKKFSDPAKRKIEIAHDVQFPMGEGGVFESAIEDLLKGKNKIVNKKIVEYVRLHRNFKYSYLVSVEASYYSLLLDILGGDTRNIMKAKELQGELESNLLEILNQDNNKFVKDEMLRYMETERLELRPEDIAGKLQRGETPISIKSIKG